MEQFMKINTAVNGFVWGPVMLALLVGTGIYLSIAVGFIQFTKIGYWWKNTIGKIFKKGEAGDGEITPLQAVSTALASTVGTGNIAGVTGAIILGGPGAVFWMWVSALFGMVTKFSEVTLAVKYRERNEKGDWCGGPMYYIKNGLGPKWKWLGGVFAVLGAIAAFGIGNIAQVHSIADSVKSVAVAFNENAASRETMICLITGICVAIFVALVLLGGVKRIGQVTEKLVPLMAVIYIVCALIVVFANVSAVPGVFASIFKGAFTPAAVTGGAAGISIKLAMTKHRQAVNIPCQPANGEAEYDDEKQRPVHVGEALHLGRCLVDACRFGEASSGVHVAFVAFLVLRVVPVRHLLAEQHTSESFDIHRADGVNSCFSSFARCPCSAVCASSR